MAYKDMLVFLDAGDDCATRVDVAPDLAARFASRLVGADIGTSAAVEGRWADQAKALRQTSEAKARTADVEAVFSRESTRAVHDAMPLLAGAEKVVLFVFDADVDARRAAIAGIQDHLERHGAKVEASGWRDTRGVDLASAMFAGLDRDDVDLIVSGAHGRSHLSEASFGGITETLLDDPSTPVMLSR